MSYTSSKGKKYNSFQDYCNSDDLEAMKIAIYLHARKRTPQNDEEAKWLEEMSQLEAQGKIVVQRRHPPLPESILLAR